MAISGSTLGGHQGLKKAMDILANGALALLQDLQLAMSGNLGIQVNTLAKFVGWFATPTSITKLFGYPVLSMAFINLYVKMKFLYTGSNLGTSTYMPIVCHHSSG